MNSKHQLQIEITVPFNEKDLPPHDESEIFTDVTYSAMLFNVITELPYGTTIISNLVVPENRSKFLYFLKTMMASKVFQEQWGFHLTLDDRYRPRTIRKVSTPFFLTKE